jgi:hypothetical protein
MKSIQELTIVELKTLVEFTINQQNFATKADAYAIPLSVVGILYNYLHKFDKFKSLIYGDQIIQYVNVLSFEDDKKDYKARKSVLTSIWIPNLTNPMNITTIINAININKTSISLFPDINTIFDPRSFIEKMLLPNDNVISGHNRFRKFNRT